MKQKNTFENYLSKIGKSEYTIKQYKNIVKRLPPKLNEKALVVFISEIVDENTKANYISAIKSFLLFSKEYSLFEKFVGGKIRWTSLVWLGEHFAQYIMLMS